MHLGRFMHFSQNVVGVTLKGLQSKIMDVFDSDSLTH